ncbi:rCG35538 [Rattus norvegicus]|uniref:RCG35538 n=1 Tax=Rattus norvegicus TaxID=10116 RepID=A6HD32_RAT|nr:rCG35538 [Rattus norvegicus]
MELPSRQQQGRSLSGSEVTDAGPGSTPYACLCWYHGRLGLVFTSAETQSGLRRRGRLLVRRL